MAQQFWVVFSENTRLDETGERGMYSTDKFNIFVDKKYADAFARRLAQKNPGVDVQVLCPSHGYYTAPNPEVHQKTWTPDGEFKP